MHIHYLLPLLTPIQRQCCCSDIPTSPNTLRFLLFSLGMLTSQLPTWFSPLITYSIFPLPASHSLFSLPCFSPFYLSLPTESTHNSVWTHRFILSRFGFLTKILTRLFFFFYTPRSRGHIYCFAACSQPIKYILTSDHFSATVGDSYCLILHGENRGWKNIFPWISSPWIKEKISGSNSL